MYRVVYTWKDGKKVLVNLPKKKKNNKQLCKEIRKLVETIIKEATAKFPTNWIVSLAFFCASVIFQIFKPFAPTYSEAMLTNFPAEGTGPMENWGDHFENGCLNCPKENTSASHWDKNIYFRPGKFAFRPKASQDGQWFWLLGCCQIKQLLTKTKITPKATWWRKHEECRRKIILNLKPFILQLAQSFSTNGDFASQGTFGKVWRHFWLSHRGEREGLLLVPGRQRAGMLLNLLQYV